jgi:hypothetical protein
MARNRHKAVAIAIPVLLVMVAGSIAAAVTAGAGKPPVALGGRTGPGAVATPSTSAAGTGNGAGTTTAAEQAILAKDGKWLTGPAGKLLGTVNADLGRLTKAQLAREHNAAKSAGARLAVAAKAALGGPMPPVDAALYRVALTDLGKAGTNAAAGDFAAAKSPQTAGTAVLAMVIAATDPVAPPAPVNNTDG